MAEVIVTPEETEDDGRELGRAEGAAEVHADEAADQAERAEIAADGATAVMEINAEMAEQAAESAMVAEDAAAGAEIAEVSVANALQAQTVAIQSLVDELRAGREATPAKTPAPKTETKAPAADKPPAKKKRGGWYWG
jgi:hypothetical protein